MSPDAMTKYRKEFEKAAEIFGWEKKEITEYHERDGDCSWKEISWSSKDGDWLFYESRLSEGLIKEIIKLSKN